jgi:tRNA A37 methylthiotransferase MiaB
MKVLLIQPPIQDFYHTPIRTNPVGLAYLASSLRSEGHEVEILDCRSGSKREMPVPPELSYLKEFYPCHDQSPFALYRGYYHFGMNWEQIRHKIVQTDADVYGISSGFTPYHGEALKVAELVKAWDSKRVVVMGGAHVSADPEGVLQNSLVDYVVLGEGERRLPLLLRELDKKGRTAAIDGIGTRLDGEITVSDASSFIDDLDALPYPARDLLDPDLYRIRKKRSTMMITSRGCPHRCAYCSAHRTMGTGFRTRSPLSIIEEMKECRKKFDVRAFDIEDDNFTYDQKRAAEVLRLIIETFGEGTLEMSAMNGVSFSSLSGELMCLMKRTGFTAINISLVSTSDALRITMGRPAAGAADFNAVLDAAERVGLNVVAYAILGMPGQTIGEMVDTVGYLMGRRVLIGPSIYYPVPGTALFDVCRKEGCLPAFPSRYRSSAIPVETENYSRLDLITLLRAVRVVNYIKGQIDTTALPEGISLKDLCLLLPERTMIAKEQGTAASGGMPGIAHRRGNDHSWQELLFRLLTERAFFYLQKGSDGGIIAAQAAHSKRVLDYFLDRLWRNPIRGSRVVPGREN